MPKTAGSAEERARKRQTPTRVGSYVLIVVALLKLAMLVSYVTGGGDLGGILLPLMVLVGLDAALCLWGGIRGLATLSDPRKARLLCVVAALIAVGSFVLCLPTPLAEDLDAIFKGTSLEVFGVVGIAALILALSCGKAAGDGGQAAAAEEGADAARPAPEPEHVPETMVASGAAAPFAPAGSHVPRAAARSGAPLLLLFNDGVADAAADGADVVDAHGNVIFHVHDDASATDTPRTLVDDAAGNRVAEITVAIEAGRAAYRVRMSMGDTFTLPLNLAGAGGDVEVGGLGWRICGDDIGGFDFEVRDEDGRRIATARRQLTSAQETRGAAIYDRAHADEIVAVLVVVRGLVSNLS